MMLGKRPRPAVFRRTTSITEFTIDLLDVEPINGSDDMDNNYSPVGHQRVLSTISPRNYTNLRSPLFNSSQISHFLRACGLCNRRLAPGRDIYMYRGDTAFCSLECRQEQIIQDEKKEKSSSSSPYTPTNNIESSTKTVGSEGCNKSGPVAAA